MSGCYIVILIIVAIQGYNTKHLDYFTSVVDLELLLNAEAKLISSVEEHLNALENTHYEINKFIEQVNVTLEKTDEKSYENPMGAFITLKRLAIDWADAEAAFLANQTEKLEHIYNNSLNNLPVQPLGSDLEGAVKAMLRLQQTYKLKTEHLANGILNGSEVTAPMSADDCYTMAVNLFALNKFSSANEWFLMAKQKLNALIALDNQIEEFPYLTEELVLDFYIPSLINAGNYKLAERLNKKMSRHYSKQNAKTYAEYIGKEIERERRSAPNTEIWKIPEKEDIVMNVCNGELRQRPSEERKLRCRYVCNMMHNCIIGPFRFEELNEEPFIAFYHNVIYEQEMFYIRNKSIELLLRSKVGTSQSAHFNDYRTSKNAWLELEDHAMLTKLLQRMPLMTGLDLSYKELLQVANYGIAGHYGPHVDFLEAPDFHEMGNRMLTALFYINDVESGGATAFPFLRIAVPPLKGGALVWYNMHKDLSCDYRTWHTGCPVLKGSKWIATQWFHAFGQEFIRLCDLQPDSHVSEKYKQRAEEYELNS